MSPALPGTFATALAASSTTESLAMSTPMLPTPTGTILPLVVSLPIRTGAASRPLAQAIYANGSANVTLGSTTAPLPLYGATGLPLPSFHFGALNLPYTPNSPAGALTQLQQSLSGVFGTAASASSDSLNAGWPFSNVANGNAPVNNVDFELGAILASAPYFPASTGSSSVASQVLLGAARLINAAASANGLTGTVSLSYANALAAAIQLQNTQSPSDAPTTGQSATNDLNAALLAQSQAIVTAIPALPAMVTMTTSAPASVVGNVPSASSNAATLQQQALLAVSGAHALATQLETANDAARTRAASDQAIISNHAAQDTAEAAAQGRQAAAPASLASATPTRLAAESASTEPVQQGNPLTAASVDVNSVMTNPNYAAAVAAFQMSRALTRNPANDLQTLTGQARRAQPLIAPVERIAAIEPSRALPGHMLQLDRRRYTERAAKVAA